MPTSGPRAVWCATALLSVAVVACWCFPRFWYSRSSGTDFFWLAEQTPIPGWQFREVPVAQSAERVLVADRLFNGEFTNEAGTIIRVFSAKRYVEKQNDIGLFVHTPDRCWTEAGWQIDSGSPAAVQVSVHGRPLTFERRVFVASGQRELVYFGGLVGGRSLPYRLDHNLAAGLRHAARTARDQTGTAARAVDRRFWGRIGESFLSREPLLGPKQFLRVSMPLPGNDPAPGDRLLTEFLARWLRPVDYRQELRAWENQAPR